MRVDARVVTIEEAAACDIVITCTASTSPLVRRGWIRSGTHVSAMGADAPGKQELDVDLVAQARLFADLVPQFITLGEFERAHLDGRLAPGSVHSLADVVLGKTPGRETSDQVTIFDSWGIALQDLVIAEAALEAARDANLVQRIGV